MKLNEEKMNDKIDEMKKKMGRDNLLNFADFMLEMMIASGDKNAMLLKKSQETIKALQKIQNESTEIKDEEILEDVINFLDDLKNKIDIYYKSLKEEK